MSDYDWTIEITPTARAAISREIKAQWDGRELAAHSSATHMTIGSSSPTRTASASAWRRRAARPGMRPARGRWLDFALAWGADRYEAGGPKYPRRFASESE
jgi:hypothetical protein